MAIVANQQEDEELNQPGAPPAPQGGGGGFVGGATGDGGGLAAKAAPGAPTSSGSFTNLSNYLQANQGAGAQTGKAAANVVDQAGDKASQAQDTYSSAGTGDVLNAGATVNVDPSVVGKLKSGEIAAKDAQVSWKGPNSVSDFTGATAGKQTAALGATQDVLGKAKAAAGGQSGVASLLRDAYQQPSYTAGENNLDSFLAGGTPSGQKELGRAAGVAQNAQGGYDQINKTLNDQINNEKGWVDSTNKAYDRAPFQTPAAVSQTGSTNAAQTVFTKRKSTAPATSIAEGLDKPTTPVKLKDYSKPSAAAAVSTTPGPTRNPNNMSPQDLADMAKSGLAAAATGADPTTQGAGTVVQGILPAPIANPIVNAATVNPFDEVKKRIRGIG